MAEQAQHPTDSHHAYRICDLVHGVSSPFVCAGNYSITGEPVTIQAAQVVIPFTKNTPREHVDALANLIPQSYPMHPHIWSRPPELVRFLVSQHPFTVTNFDPVQCGIVSAIQKTLLPNDTTNITAELHSMNITRGRGVFEVREVPADNENLGTLVVCLPVQYTPWDVTNADFVVQSHGVVNNFQWALSIAQQANIKDLQWAAFFGDCTYSLQDITMGARVTLVYILKRGEGAFLNMFSYKMPEISSITNSLKESLKDENFMKDGGVLAFPCFHLYHKEVVFKKEIAALNAKSFLKLKGVDALIGKSALDLRLKCVLHPFLIEKGNLNRLWSLKHFPTRSKIKKKLQEDGIATHFPLDQNYFENRCVWVGKQPKFGSLPLKVYKTIEEEPQNPITPAVFLFSQCILQHPNPATESTEIDFCLYSSIDIHIPAWGSDERKLSSADVIQQPVTPKLKVPRKITKNKGRRQVNNNIRRYSDDEDSESFLDEEESDEGHNNNNNNNNNSHNHNRRVYRGYSDEEDFTESVFEDEGDVDFASSWAGEDDGDYRPTTKKDEKKRNRKTQYSSSEEERLIDEEDYTPHKRTKK